MQHVPFLAVMSGWLGISPVQKIALDVKEIKYSGIKSTHQ
jgi:hypothetical protein